MISYTELFTDAPECCLQKVRWKIQLTMLIYHNETLKRCNYNKGLSINMKEYQKQITKSVTSKSGQIVQ